MDTHDQRNQRNREIENDEEDDQPVTLNQTAGDVVEEILARREEFAVEPYDIEGALVVDMGIKATGTLGAGVYLARACLADLALVNLTPVVVDGCTLPGISVEVRQPKLACMASQYAGWQITVGKFFGMGSGPMRAIYAKEKLFEHLEYSEEPQTSVGIIETGKIPDESVVRYICEKLDIDPEELTLLCARTASLAGGTQIAARTVETAMHKLHELKFDLNKVVSGYGVAPIPPVAKDDMAAIGRTNDAVLYGGRVTLYVNGPDDAIANIIDKLPATSSKDYGRPFAEVFKEYNYDFYKVDPMLFSPGAVVIQNIQTGRTFRAGKVNDEVLAKSFFS
jgi:methenyltetrahydromethanopterin cyclohydrolase